MSTVNYYRGIFDAFKDEKNLSLWCMFPDVMKDLGYVMDACQGFRDYCRENNIEANEGPYSREDRRRTLYVLEHAPRKVVGDYLFSIWRYYTHWTMYNQYDDDYVRRILRILEKKYEEDVDE